MIIKIIVCMLLSCALIGTVSSVSAATGSETQTWNVNIANGTVTDRATKDPSSGNWSFTTSRTVSRVNSGYSVGSAYGGGTTISSYGDAAFHIVHVPVYTGTGNITATSTNYFNFYFNGATIQSTIPSIK